MGVACRGLASAIAMVIFGCSCVVAQEGTFAAPKPGKEHKAFESELGTWDAVIKTWVDPNGEPMESKGVEINTLLPGGLWLISEFKGDFAGAEFHGRGQYGYDTHKKKYVGTWIDSMTTSAMLMEGDYDEKTGTLTLLGDGFDPGLNKVVKTKTVSSTKPDGSRIMTMYMVPDGSGEGVKMMEISYKKRK
jgi:hypothetical protein